MENLSSSSRHRRSYERLKVDGSATLVNERDGEITSILADLSSRGAGVVSNTPLNVDERITIVIRAPFFFENLIRKEAKIAWCKRVDDNLWQAGLDFGLDNLLQFS